MRTPQLKGRRHPLTRRGQELNAQPRPINTAGFSPERAR